MVEVLKSVDVKDIQKKKKYGHVKHKENRVVQKINYRAANNLFVRCKLAHFKDRK